MLEMIRSRAQGIFAWIIISLIVIPFAFWGVQEYLGGGPAAPAATVDGTPISQNELQRAYLQQRAQLEQMLGENFNPELFPEATMKPRLLEQLIERELFVQAAADSGMHIGDEQLARTIRSYDVFQEDGRFSSQRYRELLARQGLSTGSFEAQVRRDLLVEQLRRGVQDTEFVTPSERERQFRLINQQRDIGVMTFELQKFADKVEVTDEQIAKYYEENRGRYVQPEQVKVKYLELSVASLAKQVEVSDEQIRSYYDNHQANYRTPEERRARHILFTVNGDTEQQALEQAQKVREQIVSGELDFAEAAKEFSGDPGSAAQGGDLGFFGRNVMDPAFEKAAFTLEKGQVSEPVRSSFGYHLIKVEEMRGGQTKPFEAVKKQIETELRRERAQERFYDLAEQLANLTYEHPDTLEIAAQELGLAVQESDYFSRQGGKGIAMQPAVTAAAFGEEVLERGNNSSVLELGPNRLLVLRLADRKPETQRPLDEVKEQIRSQLRAEALRKAAQQAAEEALKAVREGEQPSVVAERTGGQWQRFEAVTRDAREPAGAVVGKAFMMPHPPSDAPEWDRAPLPGGGQAVVGLFSVQQPESPDELPAQKREQIIQANREAAYDAFVQSLRAGAEITITNRRE